MQPPSHPQVENSRFSNKRLKFFQNNWPALEISWKIGSPGKPFLYPGGRNAAGGVIGGAPSQQGTTSGCIAYPGGSSRTFCCFSQRLRRRPPGANVFTAARKPTPLISSFWDFVFARYRVPRPCAPTRLFYGHGETIAARGTTNPLDGTLATFPGSRCSWHARARSIWPIGTWLDFRGRRTIHWGDSLPDDFDGVCHGGWARGDCWNDSESELWGLSRKLGDRRQKGCYWWLIEKSVLGKNITALNYWEFLWYVLRWLESDYRKMFCKLKGARVVFRAQGVKGGDKDARLELWKWYFTVWKYANVGNYYWRVQCLKFAAIDDRFRIIDW